MADSGQYLALRIERAPFRLKVVSCTAPGGHTGEKEEVRLTNDEDWMKMKIRQIMVILSAVKQGITTNNRINSAFRAKTIEK